MRKKYSQNVNKPKTLKSLLSYCYFLLGRKDYSEGEIVSKLKQRYELKGEDDMALLKQVIDRLKELSFVNDDRYARAVVRSHLNYKSVGKNKIRHSLIRKRIPSEIISEVFEEIEIDEIPLAITCLKKKWHIVKKIEGKNERKAKISRLLANRGFSSSTIVNVLQRYDDLATLGLQ